MPVRSTPFSFAGRTLALVFSTLLIGCQDNSQPPATTELSSQAPGTIQTTPQIIRVPFGASAHSLLVDDVDGDGRMDIALTSHDANFTQIFLQGRQGVFSAGPRVEEVGFHPGELIRLPDKDQRLYLMYSEGENRLRVYTPTSAGGLTQVTEMGLTAPRHGTVFHWPDWDLGIAVAPYGPGLINVVKNFDPLTGKATGVAIVHFTPAAVSALAVAAADLDADGADEILFTNSISNTVSVIRAPKSGAIPVAEALWRFQPGGRPHEVIPADIDQDGHIDLLVPDTTDKRELDRTDINVLVNDGAVASQLVRSPFPHGQERPGACPESTPPPSASNAMGMATWSRLVTSRSP